VVREQALRIVIGPMIISSLRCSAFTRIGGAVYEAASKTLLRYIWRRARPCCCVVVVGRR
jgi:hypothetical protein